MSKELLFFVVLTVASPSVLKAQDSSEAGFWSWFVENGRELYYSAGEENALVRELKDKLREVNPLLTAELERLNEDGRRVFIIGCGARKEGIPAVRRLFRAAPVALIPRWKIVTFTPGRIHLRDEEYGGISVRAADVRAVFFRGGADGLVSVLLLIPEYTAEQDAAYRKIARMLLVDALGEYETMTKIDRISVGSSASPYYREGVPYQGMPTEFNYYWYALRKPR